MKYRLIIISLLLLGFACNAQNKIDKQGRRQGKWIKTDTELNERDEVALAHQCP